MGKAHGTLEPEARRPFTAARTNSEEAMLSVERESFFITSVTGRMTRLLGISSMRIVGRRLWGIPQLVPADQDEGSKVRERATSFGSEKVSTEQNLHWRCGSLELRLEPAPEANEQELVLIACRHDVSDTAHNSLAVGQVAEISDDDPRFDPEHKKRRAHLQGDSAAEQHFEATEALAIRMLKHRLKKLLEPQNDGAELRPNEGGNGYLDLFVAEENSDESEILQDFQEFCLPEIAKSSSSPLPVTDTIQ